MNQNTISQEQVFTMVGQQAVELAVLRERVRLLSAHQCEPCAQSCCAPQPQEPTDG